MDEQHKTTPLGQQPPLVPTDLPGSGQGCDQNVPQVGHREKKIPQVQKQAFLSAEAGLNRDENHPVPLTYE